jgi:formylglycine-generating enzyme required for sulfatase activity
MRLVALVVAALVPPQSDPKSEKVTIPDTKLSFDLVLVPGGKFKMGSPDGESGRGKDEGPVREVEVKPFWMGRHEVTWDEFEAFYLSGDKFADTNTRPTFPYEPPDRGMGKTGYPAMSIQWRAAKCYCDWLSKKTGKKYRLPTEAEWEYACRAGSDKPQPEPLDDHAWYDANSNKKNQEIGKKKPNAFGLCDMLGGVWEYCLEFYGEALPDGEAWKKAMTHLCDPYEKCEHVLRGGSWASPASELRAANRQKSLPDWNDRDPNRPRSVWWLTDGPMCGFRVVREAE